MSKQYYEDMAIECGDVSLSVGSPMVIVGRNIAYLLGKYEVRKIDLKGTFKHLSLSYVTLKAIADCRLNNISIFILTLFVAFLRRKYGAVYTVGDLFVDLEARERLANF